MTRVINYAAALKEAIAEEMEKDEKIYLLGQDIKYSVWGVTGGLNERFGEERVIHAPISENGFVGAAVGSALLGSRPIVELMYSDFLLLAADAVADQAAKYRYMCNGGDFKVALTIRAAGAGVGTGSGLHHSQDLEATFLHFPGLKVVYPSTPADAKGLLKTAIRDDNPVLFFEHKLLYGTKGEVPEEEYTIPFGEAAVRRKGADCTIVSWGHPCNKVLEAADKLSKEGIEVEVIDPRTLVPFDEDTLFKSLQKTGKLLIVEDGVKKGGVGSEIAALVAEKAVTYLDAPVFRLGSANVPIPGSRYGEKYMIPSVDDIVEAAKKMYW